MDELDQGITRALQAGAALADPSKLDVTSVLTGAVRRKHRRRLLTASLAAASVLAVAGIAAVVSGSKTPTVQPIATPASDVIPWIDKAATLPPTPVRPSPAVAYASCQVDQLQVTSPGGGAAAGNLSSPVVLRNKSTSSCSLSGYPTHVIGIRRDGQQTALAPTHGTMFDTETADPANLEPGQSATVILATGGSCDAAVVPTRSPNTQYAGVRLGLPGGGEVSAPTTFDTVCGFGVTTYGVAPPAQTPANVYPGLTASADLPAHAVGGSTLHYVVTLTNTTAEPITFNGCPAYSEGAYLNGASGRVLELNCEPANPIGPGQSRRFAMELVLPDGVGPAKFSWYLPQTDATTGGMIELTAG